MHAPILKPVWWQDWRGLTAAIIGGGPTAKNRDIELLRGKVKVVVINESWQLAPWADVLYGCDGRWWKLRQYVQEFKGLRLTFDQETADREQNIHKIEVDTFSDKILLDKPGRVGSGGNSGFQMLNLVAHFGATRILLIGFDMHLDAGEHWHGRHPPPLSNPCPISNLPRWRRALDLAQPRLEQLGVSVINCSPTSALTAYPKMTIAQALM